MTSTCRSSRRTTTPTIPVYYYLFSPADLEPAVTESGNVEVSAVDATPTPDNPTGNASLIAPDPQPGLWEIDVMQGATTDGTEFSQTVTGVVAYNQLAPVTETGLPASTSTTIDSGSSVPITVTVKNTTNHVGVLRTAVDGHRHQWRQYRHASGAGGRSHGDADGDAVADGSLREPR